MQKESKLWVAGALRCSLRPLAGGEGLTAPFPKSHPPLSPSSFDPLGLATKGP